jgi:TRAP transporter TAXI family solute receptor
MLRKELFKLGLVMVFTVSFLLTPYESVLAGPEAVKDIAIISHDVGSQAFLFSAGIADGVQKVSGIRTRVIPSGTDVGKMLALRGGEVNFAILPGSAAWFSSHGTGDFSALDWGPQPVRMAWRGQDLLIGYYTRGNSGIKKLSDLKGKRVPQVPGSVSLSNLIKGALAFGGLSLSDCIVVNVSGLGAMGKAVNEGAADFSNFGTTGSPPIECAASPNGIYWFDLDPSDKAAWERLWEFCPYTDVGLAERYAGKEKGIKPFHVLSYPYILTALENTSDEVVYAYAKAMWDSYDIYKTKHVELPYWSHENLAKTEGCFYPYHNALVKFMKEKGIWTSDHDKFQQQQLNNEAKRIQLWKEAVKEAQAKKLKSGSGEFQAFWWNKLSKAGLLR